MIKHAGPKLNWFTRQNVFQCIDDYIGSHGQAVKYAAFRFNVCKTSIYEWLKDGAIVHKLEMVQITGLSQGIILTIYYITCGISTANSTIRKCPICYGINSLRYIIRI